MKRPIVPRWPISSHGGLSFHVGNNASAGGTHAPGEGITPSLVTERQDARQAAEQAMLEAASEGTGNRE